MVMKLKTIALTKRHQRHVQNTTASSISLIYLFPAEMQMRYRIPLLQSTRWSNFCFSKELKLKKKLFIEPSGNAGSLLFPSSCVETAMAAERCVGPVKPRP